MARSAPGKGVKVMAGLKKTTKAVPTKNRTDVQNVYQVKLDSKKRFTLRNARYAYYEVKELMNGKILLEPKVLVGIEDIPQDTLATIGRAKKNPRKGVASAPVEPD